MADLPEETPITDEDLKKQVLDNLDALDRRGKLRVLDFTSGLATRESSRKVDDTGGALLAFAGMIPKEDLEEMKKVIEEEFGKVDPNEW